MPKINVIFEGKSQELEVDIDDTLETLRFQIFSLLEIEPESQVLRLNGGLLRSDSSLAISKVGIMEGATVEVATVEVEKSQAGEGKGGGKGEGKGGGKREAKDVKSSIPNSFDENVARLLQMGFPYDKVIQALQMYDNDMNRAATVLLGNPDPRVAPTAMHSTGGSKPTAMLKLQRRVEGLLQTVMAYEDPLNQTKALSSIPASTLQRNAKIDTLNQTWKEKPTFSSLSDSLTLHGPYTLNSMEIAPNDSPPGSLGGTLDGEGGYVEWRGDKVVGIKAWGGGEGIIGFVAMYEDGKEGEYKDSMTLRGRAEGKETKFEIPKGDLIIAGKFHFQSSSQSKPGHLMAITFTTKSGKTGTVGELKSDAVAKDFKAPAGHYLSGFGGDRNLRKSGGFCSMACLYTKEGDEAKANLWIESKLAPMESLPVYRDLLVKRLLAWFKGGFFRWTVVKCEKCGGDTRTTGMDRPSSEELKWGAGRVEIHSCNKCSHPNRFPRYNHPGKLMETRMGRCGEFANAFTLICRSLNIPARHVMDWTDHVWTEVYSEELKRWVHTDPCERAFDAPLLYEKGWGKKLSYILATWACGVTDVTRRYTRKFQEVKLRRNLTSESEFQKLIQNNDRILKAMLPPVLRNQVQQWDAKENLELAATLALPDRDAKESESAGRITGSVEWKAARGELGNQRQMSPEDLARVVMAASTASDNAKVFSIHVRAGLWVDFMEFIKEGGIKRHYGTPGGSVRKSFEIPRGEYLYRIEARMGDHLDSVRFHTQKGTSSQWYGSSGGGSYRVFEPPRGKMITGLRVANGMCPPILGIITANAPKDAVMDDKKESKESSKKSKSTPQAREKARKALAGYIKMISRGCGAPSCSSDHCRSNPKSTVYKNEVKDRAAIVQEALILLKKKGLKGLCPGVRKS